MYLCSVSTDNLQIKFTLDGSPTLYRADIDEHYHSSKGALAESRHVFIESGLMYRLNQSPLPAVLSVLEIGLGTGLNAALSAISASENLQRVEYTALEPFPPSLETLQAISYSSDIDYLIKAIYQASWNEKVDISPYFTLLKLDSSFPQSWLQQCDVVYFDAFSPEKQPQMWTSEGFCKIHEAMNPGGVFTTYCAKGAVRRMLQSVGFTTERLQGPPGGKREILRAIKHRRHGQS